SLAIACTAGWDTDCNAGNVGCLVGIAGGLAAIDAGPDWRGPVADRMYLSSAEGGRAITDAVIEAQSLVRAGQILKGHDPAPLPKNARFNFAFPGSVQGFAASGAEAVLENVSGHSVDGDRSVAIRFARLTETAPLHVATPSFAMRSAFSMRSYQLSCSPTLYPGQVVELRIEADVRNAGTVAVFVHGSCFGAEDRLKTLAGPERTLAPGEAAVLHWQMPDTGGQPIAEIGVGLRGCGPEACEGSLYLDYVRWSGSPDMVLRRPEAPGEMWFRAWVNDASHFSNRFEAFRVSQDQGRGLVTQGTRDWADYTVEASLRPDLARAWGLAARVQGLRRYYAALFEKPGSDMSSPRGTLRLIRMRDAEETLAVVERDWSLDTAYTVKLCVKDGQIQAFVDGVHVLAATDSGALAIPDGGIGILCEEGAVATDAIVIRPA
ncbi:MAG TPA: ADP-ribosylglycohydrolase family protein, partial [Rhodopila sp.]